MARLRTSWRSSGEACTFFARCCAKTSARQAHSESSLAKSRMLACAPHTRSVATQTPHPTSGTSTLASPAARSAAAAASGMSSSALSSAMAGSRPAPSSSSSPRLRLRRSSWKSSRRSSFPALPDAGAAGAPARRLAEVHSPVP
eukprot:9103491-Alexandrium_andersonii.AAC.1